jgi:DNA modification methylase
MIYHGDCLKVMPTIGRVDCVFVDPPDNIGLAYGKFIDRNERYVEWLRDLTVACMAISPIVWISYNARHQWSMGAIIAEILGERSDWLAKPIVQTFTFGQHNHRDFGNCHRPMVRLHERGAKFYPDAVREKSWRQLHGDKRADPRGRVPGDVWQIPRVTGNSKQRRAWHPTQLNELLVERAIKFSTKPGDRVLDPCAGTGTTLRVCKRLGRDCVAIDVDADYCQKIAEENGEPIYTH